MVVEDYTLKHVWGPQIQTPIKAPVAASTSRVSNPGSPLLGFSHPGATLTGCLVKGRESAGGKLPERFSLSQRFGLWSFRLTQQLELQLWSLENLLSSRSR